MCPIVSLKRLCIELYLRDQTPCLHEYNLNETYQHSSFPLNSIPDNSSHWPSCQAASICKFKPHFNCFYPQEKLQNLMFPRVWNIKINYLILSQAIGHFRPFFQKTLNKNRCGVWLINLKVFFLSILNHSWKKTFKIIKSFYLKVTVQKSTFNHRAIRLPPQTFITSQGILNTNKWNLFLTN